MAHGKPTIQRHSRQNSRIATAGFTGSREEQVIAGDQTDIPAKSGDQTTVAFVKRTLCSRPPESRPSQHQKNDEVDSQSLEDLLPPLTSSNDIDLQLYGLIAVILNQFVQTWYNRITPDCDFVGEVVRIIAHCTRGLEQRLRNMDLECLLMDELPALMDAHIESKQLPVRISTRTPH